VLEIPPQVFGLLNDMWMRAAEGIGIAGPEQGKGSKYLVLPAAFVGGMPDGYFVVRPKTHSNWFILRGFPTPEGDANPALGLMKKARIYSQPEESRFLGHQLS
jgi:hypothetical protein